jgi:hypothetical protein
VIFLPLLLCTDHIYRNLQPRPRCSLPHTTQLSCAQSWFSNSYSNSGKTWHSSPNSETCWRPSRMASRTSANGIVVSMTLMHSSSVLVHFSLGCWQISNDQTSSGSQLQNSVCRKQLGLGIDTCLIIRDAECMVCTRGLWDTAWLMRWVQAWFRDEAWCGNRVEHSGTKERG